MAVNIPNTLPAFTVMSFNLNGALADPLRKLKWINNTFVKPGKADVILLQELHWKSMADLRKSFWAFRGQLIGLML